MMKPARPLLFWMVAVAAIASMVALLREALLPFFGGLVLAYLVLPLVTRLERLGLSRSISALALILLSGATITLALLFFSPVIVNEITYFIESFPRYLKSLEDIASNAQQPWLSKFIGPGFAHARHSLDELVTVAGNSLGDFVISLWSGGRAFIAFLSLAVVTPIIAFYLVCDWDLMVLAIQRWIPEPHRKTAGELASEIDRTISGFITGQATLCLILAAFYAVALHLLGLNHGILIGIFAGLISFIPYVGAITGMVLATCVAIAQFWPSTSLILVAPLVFVAGQTIGDYVLSPYLIGRRIHLNPVWVMFALFAFGYLFGFLGLIIAMPCAAAIGVVVRYSSKQYLKDSTGPQP